MQNPEVDIGSSLALHFGFFIVSHRICCLLILLGQQGFGGPPVSAFPAVKLQKLTLCPALMWVLVVKLSSHACLANPITSKPTVLNLSNATTV